MKKILIPVDYSAASRQAVRYGFYLAKHSNAQLIFLHVFDIPIVSVDAYSYVPSQSEIDSIKDHQLINLQQFIHQDFQINRQRIPVHYECLYGNPIELINSYATQKKADLIIMGIQGRCARPSYFMGSSFVDVVRHSSIPVIGLHGNTKFTQLKNILFTCDLKNLKEETNIKPLLKLSKCFNANIHLLHIFQENGDVALIEKYKQVNLGHLNSKVICHSIQHKDVVEGIREFLRHKQIDLISFIPREHELLFKLLRKSITRKASFHINRPLIAIHN